MGVEGGGGVYVADMKFHVLTCVYLGLYAAYV